MEQELFTLPEHLSSIQVFSGVRVTWSLVFCEVLYRSLFVLLSLFAWLLSCLHFFYLRILITLLVSSSSSYWFQYVLYSTFLLAFLFLYFLFSLFQYIFLLFFFIFYYIFLCERSCNFIFHLICFVYMDYDLHLLSF